MGRRSGAPSAATWKSGGAGVDSPQSRWTEPDCGEDPLRRVEFFKGAKLQDTRNVRNRQSKVKLSYMRSAYGRSQQQEPAEQGGSLTHLTHLTCKMQPLSRARSPPLPDSHLP